MKRYLIFILFALPHLVTISQTNQPFYQAQGLLSIDTTIYTFVEKQPEFFGGMSCLFQYITNYTKRPEGEMERTLSGTVYVTFVVERDGSLSNIRVLRGISGSKAFDGEAIRVVRAMQKWVPAENNGKRVRVQYNLPVRFKREEEVKKDSILADGSRIEYFVIDSSTVFTVVEQPAEFPGGDVALQKYIKQNLKYPATAKKEGRSGTCYITFIVERDGNLTYVTLLRGLHGDDLDEEALRLVK